MNYNIDYKGVARLEKKIDQMDEEIQTISRTVVSIDEQLKASNEMRELQIQNLDNRVSSLENNQNKIIWAIIMAVLGALLSLVII